MSEVDKIKKSTYDRERYLRNREATIKAAVLWKRENREHVNRLQNLRNSQNRELVRSKYNRNYHRNRSKHRARVNKYLQENPHKRKAWRSKHRKTSVIAKLQNSLRSRIHAAVKFQATEKHERSRFLIGCTCRFFREFLEFQFRDGMTWDNYGKLWQIDHVIPVSSFDLTNKDQQRLAFNYSNCQPLEKEKNKAKGDTMPGPHQPWLI